MAEFAFHNVSKRYDPGLFKMKVQAVRELSLEVRSGEVFGLIGPNGAGKSTTIRLLLGLIRPDNGVIRFRGRPLAEAGIQGEIGYLPENPYLYDHLTLRELLDFCGRCSGLEPATCRRRSELLLAKVAMTEAQNRPLRTFSKGMLQRAGICFALLHDPAAVILDEPMSGLDPLGRKMVFDIVQELKGEGKTVFFCSHILSDVERLCDRIGVLVRGRLARIYEGQEFRDDASRSIHLLLGPLNPEQRQVLALLPAEIQEVRSGLLLSTTSANLADIITRLAALGIAIHGTRTERVSLEDLFLQTVEENSR